MSSELEILEKIELYTRGRLSQEETLDFESQMEQDPQLKKRVLSSSIVDEIVVSHEAMKLKAIMQKDMAKPSYKREIYLSAALLVLAVGGVFYYSLPTEKETLPVVIETKQASVQTKANVIENKTNIPPAAIPETSLAPKNEVREKVTVEAKASPVPEIQQKTIAQEKMESITPHMPSVQSYEKETVKPHASKSTETVALPCKSIFAEVDFYTVASCAERETGELHIKQETTKAGTPPFTFVLEGRSATSSFHHLPSGTYRLLVKDAKGCTFENSKEVVVASKACKEKKEYAYNPEFDPSWAIPYDTQKEPTSFKVMDKGGKSFFQTAVAGNHPAEWKGESSQGLLLGSGAYFFYIEYSDGTVDEGSIIVTR